MATDGPPPSRRDDERAVLGFTGATDAASLRSTLRTNQLGFYPLIALGVLGIADQFQGYAFTVLTPDISATLGIGVGAIAAARAVQTLANALSPLPMAALSQRRARRAMLCIVTGIGWSVITLFTGLIGGLVTLLLVLALDGLTTGSVAALHYPLLMDSYVPSARVRILSTYNAFIAFGNVLSPLLVAALSTAVIALTWRGDFIVLGIIAVVGTLFATGLRDPGFGRWDTEALRSLVHDTPTDREAEEVVPSRLVQLGFFEILQRLLLIPTVRRLLSGYLVFGILIIPFTTFLSFFLAERWNMGPAARGLFFAVMAASSMTGLLFFGSRGERIFRADPGRMARLAGLTLAVAVVFLSLGALSPVFGLMVAFFAIGETLVAILVPCLNVVMLSVVPSQQRPHTSAVAGVAAAAGAVLGSLLLSGVDSRYGLGGSIVSLVVPGVAGALIIASAGRFVDRDVDRMIDEVVEDEEVRAAVGAGRHLPLLTARGLSFSYDRLQVLFDVDLTVEDGEMIALLGVNGAGKSTLLNVLSGLNLPSGGTVRYQGLDITYLDAERRLALGIAAVPGGRAVFPPLSVIDNLRTYAFTLGTDRHRVGEAIDGCFERFPALADLRDRPASTLSGGEQQMLGLSKAFLLAPRLLLIDELSLGLAPVAVARLMDMVRAINAAGTSVVLVEQSINVAMDLVDRCYFMERGQIRFDGRPAELIERGDLLRAVFLGADS